ncbi:TonB-dependent receptor [Aliifodinibius sp. S!AR15-10]|uniref:SusC/RagA family TonB-linked outer membrane protein n=1 Tax=Aliifodinibius sp. S!AR15-10 TaxID=2950437 RepID=UPI0028628B66|nr:TonB-dependent receptor [Aliifodinibius sp. S!AR15-10]MDR8393798.1 TonB-dependent receptor [Aliifodinibius sp. S!AR15-10]
MTLYIQFKKFALLMVLATFIVHVGHAQQVEGVVTDAETGESLPGVNVVVQGTTSGTSTDSEGNYSLNVPSLQDTLVFSFIGYQTQSVPIDGRSSIDIALQSQAISGEELVVVGYGTQEKANLTGSVSSIGGDEIAKRPVTNTASLLQGRAPGIQVVQNSGQPGAEDVNIQIRGQGTFSGAGSEPLVLIDGVPGSLSDVAPNDISNISVLKDAASASIYGARGANGVIIVETKEGRSGEFLVSYQGQYAIHTPTKSLDLITNSAEYMRLFNEARRNTGITSGLYPEEEIAKYENGDSEQYPSTDWMDIMIDPAPVHEHQLNFSGGNEATTYRVSLAYTNQDGVMRGFNYERFNTRVKVSSQVTEAIEFGGNIGLQKGMRENPAQSGEDTYLSTLSQAPTYRPTLPDGRYTFKAYPFEYNNKNTVAIVENEVFSNITNYTVNSQLWVNIDFSDKLTWYTKGAVNADFDENKTFRPEVQLYNYHTGEPMSFLDVGGRGLTVNDNRNIFTNLYSYFNYTDTYGQFHNFHAQVGYSQEENTYQYLEGFRQEYVTSNLRVLNAGTPSIQRASGLEESWALMSIFGRVNYNYDERYFLEANLRYDGTSRISPQERWGLFPSYSVGWRISEENFISNSSASSWLSELKLRASYGELGNQNIGLYPYQSLLTFTGNYSFDNSQLSPGVAQTSLSNRNLKWESTTVLDIGMDLTLFESLDITFDWYSKRTEDILRSSQVTDLVGLSAPVVNSGEMLNKGVELGIQYRKFVNGGALDGLQYQIGVNFDKYTNELVTFGEREIRSYSILQEGEEWDAFYMLETEGIFQSTEEVNNAPPQFSDNTQPGDLRYKDQNGDGVINQDDRVIIDGRHPDFNYSFNLSGQWKGFDASLFFQGVKGQKYFATNWGQLPFTQGSPPAEYWKDRWTEENPSESLPRIYFGFNAPQKLTRPSTFWLENGSYLRLKNVNVGYTFGSELVGTIGLRSARIFFSGDNLLTFTPFPGLDPERAGSGNFVRYPQNKVYSFGVNVEF